MTRIITDPADWPAWAEHFKPDEFRCSHTGKLKVSDDLLKLLQVVRGVYATPMIITSGYRDPTHPIEAAKTEPGAHSYGAAADISTRTGADAARLVRLVFQHTPTETIGVGISQRPGLNRFVHIDVAWSRRTHSTIWSY